MRSTARYVWALVRLKASAISAPTPFRPPTTQEHILNLLGLFVLDRGECRLPAALLVRALRDVPVEENAVRVTLHRMVQRGVLSSRRSGRNVAYAPTEAGIALLRRGRERVFSPDPFGHAEGGWTLLNISPSIMSDDTRYQVQVHLGWGGFAALEPRLWIAPGKVDVAALLRSVISETALDELTVFHGVDAPPTKMTRLIARAWDVEAISQEHAAFLGAWEHVTLDGPALPLVLRLLHNWTELLIHDPGLPMEALGSGRASARSTATFRRLFDELHEPARREFDQLATSA